MNDAIRQIEHALYDARRAYHNSTQWGEPIDGDKGETFDGAIMSAMMSASSRIDALETALQCMNYRHQAAERLGWTVSGQLALAQAGSRPANLNPTPSMTSADA